MKQQAVLVTGASRGIGRAICEQLTRAGQLVVGISRSPIDLGWPSIACDLASADDTARCLAEIGRRFNITGVVNNVGIVSPQAIAELDFRTLETVFDLNVRTAVQIVQWAAPGMRQRRHGRIINVCSRAIRGARDRTAYAAAKSALVGCTKTWALELADCGITSNAVAPGPVETELFRRTRPSGSAAERRVLDSIPLRRIGTPDEIAAAVCFLLSPEAGFITGQVLSIDGGASLGSGG